MKKFLLACVVSMLSVANVYSQAITRQPEFPGGMEALSAWLKDNVRYPLEVNDVYGKVFVKFVVQPDGSVGNVEVAEPLNPYLDAEAVRLVESMPKWNPGIVDGKAVGVRFAVYVKFSADTKRSESKAVVTDNNAGEVYPTIYSVFSVKPKRYSDGVRSWESVVPRVDKQNVKKIRLNEYDTDYQFKNGFLCVYNRENHCLGFVDAKGNLLQDGFRWASPLNGRPNFVGGLAIVKEVEHGNTSVSSRSVSWYILDKDGKKTKLNYSIYQASDFNEDGVAAILVHDGFRKKLKYINSKGQIVFEHISGMSDSLINLGSLYDGLAVYYDSVKRLYGYVDKNGQIVIPAQFLYAEDFSEGLALVKTHINGAVKYIFINTQGKQAFDKHFTKRPLAFSNGYAAVKKTNGMCVYIDKKGNVCSEEYNNLTRFYPNGLALADCGETIAVLDSGLNEISSLDRDFKYIYGGSLGDGAPLYFNGVFWDGYKTFFDYKGNELTINAGNNGEVRAVTDEGLVHVKFQDGYYDQPLDGYIDCTGKYVFVFDKEEF